LILESDRTLLGGLLLDPEEHGGRAVLEAGARRPRGGMRCDRTGAPPTRVAEGILVLSKDTANEETTE
jgi:hypothetical protein